MDPRPLDENDELLSLAMPLHREPLPLALRHQRQQQRPRHWPLWLLGLALVAAGLLLRAVQP